MISSVILHVLEFCFFPAYVFWISCLVASKILKCLLHQIAVNVWNSSFYCAFVFCYRTDWTSKCKKHLIRNYLHDKLQKHLMICPVKIFLAMGSTVPRFKIRTVLHSPENNLWHNVQLSVWCLHVHGPAYFLCVLYLYACKSSTTGLYIRGLSQKQVYWFFI